MITLLTGENSFEIKRALDDVVSAFDGVPEKIDGSAIELSQLMDVLTGSTLFSDKRLVIIHSLSDNKMAWGVFPNWLNKLADHVHLVLIEPKLDKRTKTYKELLKSAKIIEPYAWKENDIFEAERWVAKELDRHGLSLDKKSVQFLVRRVGADPWRLDGALKKLALITEPSISDIEFLIEAEPSENVFSLFDAALRADYKKVIRTIRDLQKTQDPYMIFGLLSGQAFQLAALSTSTKPSSEIAKDIGVHPYSLGKLSPYAKNLKTGQVRTIIECLARADIAMKSTAADPWLLIEKALIEITEM